MFQKCLLIQNSVFTNNLLSLKNNSIVLVSLKKILGVHLRWLYIVFWGPITFHVVSTNFYTK